MSEVQDSSARTAWAAAKRRVARPDQREGRGEGRLIHVERDAIIVSCVCEIPKPRRRIGASGGGDDRNIDDLRTLSWMIDYIHSNPVRRGLTERAVDWEWSSARWYAGMRPVRLEMDRTLPMFEE